MTKLREFEAPIVAIGPFIQATRDSGYNSAASAIAELIDNSIEAGATRISIVLTETSDPRDSEVSVLDNGSACCDQRRIRASTARTGAMPDGVVAQIGVVGVAQGQRINAVYESRAVCTLVGDAGEDHIARDRSSTHRGSRPIRPANLPADFQSPRSRPPDCRTRVPATMRHPQQAKSRAQFYPSYSGHWRPAPA